MVITVNLVDFNTDDGIRSLHIECGLCLEGFKRGETGIPVITGTYGLIRVCRSCWACGYVAVDLDKLEALVREHTNTGNQCELTEIHCEGEFQTSGIDPKVIVNTTDNAQVWAMFADGCNTDVTDESI